MNKRRRFIPKRRKSYAKRIKIIEMKIDYLCDTNHTNSIHKIVKLLKIAAELRREVEMNF